MLYRPARSFIVKYVSASVFGLVSYRHRWDPCGTSVSSASRRQQALLPSCIYSSCYKPVQAQVMRCHHNWFRSLPGERSDGSIGEQHTKGAQIYWWTIGILPPSKDQKQQSEQTGCRFDLRWFWVVLRVFVSDCGRNNERRPSEGMDSVEERL